MKTRVPGAADDGEDDDPEILALLDFEPVPRQREVEGGWTPERQREFIARLAVHGSATRACDEMGKNQSGIMKLYRSPLGASFRAAWDAAVALAKRRRAEREAALAPVSPDMKPPTVDHRWKHGRFARSSPMATGPVSLEDKDEEEDEAEQHAWLVDILTKYWAKVVAERTARLSGEIAAADFYLRQLTWLEVTLDVASGGKGLEQLDRLRHDGLHLTDIAETMMSRLLDDVRREAWREMGEPERPEHPPRHLLVEHQGPLGSYSTEPLEFTRGGIDQSHDEQMAVFRRRHEEAAAAQVAWERRAHEDWAARQPTSLPPF